MQIETDDWLLEKCKKLIENKLRWGSSDIWSNHDFERLSIEIEEATRVRLSVATLKRIWGKVKYNSKPTTTTLDILARFLEFENWRVFKLTHFENSRKAYHINGNGHQEKANGIQPFENSTSGDAGSKQKNPFRYWGISLALIIAALSFFYFTQKKSSGKNEPVAKAYSFSSKKMVSTGVPNSVIFNYDATAANDDDTIYIQQSWDERLREQVSKNAHNYTSIYYYPGFFVAKLVVNGKIAKEHSLHIQTNGWLPLVEQPNVPVYFKKEDIFMDGMMTLPVEKMRAFSIAMQPETPWVEFQNVRDFGGLKSNNFIFETELKNDFSEGSGACQMTEIHIRLAGGLFMIPLSIKGCVSNLRLMDVDGLVPDVSALGCDFSNWVKVRLEVNNGKGTIFIDDKKAVDVNLNFTPLEIKGLMFRFQGTGSVNYVKLSKVNGEIVYEDQFEKHSGK